MKPDIMRHEDLCAMETANPGAYVILTFEGLFMLADKNGVFAWRLLHLDLWPLLDYDREKTLSLLESAKFIRRFQDEGKQYGHVVNFRKHQRINGKEAIEESKFPDPPSGKQQGSNGEAPEKHLGAQGNGNGNGNDICRAVIEHLNLRTARQFNPKAKDAESFIRSRVTEGYTLEDFKAVIDFKVQQWRTDEKMREFLRPSTLFRPKFSEYLAEARARGKPIPKVIPDASKPITCPACGGSLGKTIGGLMRCDDGCGAVYETEGGKLIPYEVGRPGGGGEVRARG